MPEPQQARSASCTFEVPNGYKSVAGDVLCTDSADIAPSVYRAKGGGLEQRKLTLVGSHR
eukprot:CAMPEP_0119370850 /NCGR_PEP_ID=MMETSP1334-20130426/17141_1 /TAXON_ID=127549 /ORGANISM="Calcidiscus leptoporus, Strain RCC1130" /LENGTH=59 /DNA_ID=CAMNT_0007388001 /DNA_START=149 /DNA_END=324 /DNA_ORIENTATION=+